MLLQPPPRQYLKLVDARGRRERGQTTERRITAGGYKFKQEAVAQP
jgi:hypothetical protein